MIKINNSIFKTAIAFYCYFLLTLSLDIEEHKVIIAQIDVDGHGPVCHLYAPDIVHLEVGVDAWRPSYWYFVVDLFPWRVPEAFL